MLSEETQQSGRVIGRYVLYTEIAAGGMATVHLGRLLGPAGFSRVVAIKRLHPQFAKDPEFVAMFLDEARLAGRVRHPNVASVLDVVALEGELFLVMEYVQGESLSRLLRNAEAMEEFVPIPVAVGIVCGTLRGLHAAHETTGETGEPLNLVHRDVSPHNVLVGVDGVPRVVDFGVAKAATRTQTTREGQLKGKLSYMSPEQVHHRTIDRRSDIYAAAVVLWETLMGRRLFTGDDVAGILGQITAGAVAPPSRYRSGVPPELDQVVMRGLALREENRYPTAREMALALEDAYAPASGARIGDWVEETAKDALYRRAQSLTEIESRSAGQVVVRQGEPGAEGPESGVQTMSLSWDDSAFTPAGPGSSTDATVVDGARRQIASSPTISTAASTLIDQPRRRPGVTALVALGIGVGGLTAGVLLGLGGAERAPSDEQTGSPGAARGAADIGASTPAPGEPTPAERSSGEVPTVPLEALPVTSAPSASTSEPESAAEDAPRSRARAKRGKGRARRRYTPRPKARPEQPQTGVDFDDLTRK